MKRHLTKIIGTCVISIALGSGVGMMLPALAEETPPGPPPWIRADGTIDESQFPAGGIPAYDLDGNIECNISLATYLNAGGAMVVDIVTDSNTPADEFEADADTSHTGLDEQYLDNQMALELPASTLC